MRARDGLGSATSIPIAGRKRGAPRVLLLVLLLLPLAALLPVSSTRVAAQVPGSRPFAIVTYNLFQGTNFTEVFAAQTPAQFVAAVTTTIQNVRATAPPERMATIARLIAAQRPDVVTLQEAAQWRTGPLGGPATTIEFDFLQLLLDELARQGQPYTTVGIRQGLQIDAPSTLGTTVGYTDRDAIIARSDLAAAGFLLGNVQIQSFTTNTSVQIPGQGAVTVPRGWVSVDVTSQGKTFRVVTSHPEPIPPDLEIAQVQELLRGPLATNLPVVLAGDLNANATDATDPTFASYRALLGAGFLDAWVVSRPGDPGLTCCQALDLRNPVPTYTSRLDLVLIRNGFSVFRTQLLGNTPADRTPSGLWPSDHAGLLAVLSFAPVASSQNPPPLSGQAGTPCTTVPGSSCTVTGNVVGAAHKTGSTMAFTLSATAPGGTVPGGTPVAFVPTTAGVQSFACAPLPIARPLLTTCTGTTSGDALQNATITVRFPRASGVAELTGTISGPGPSQPAARAAVQVVLTGPLGVPPVPPPLPILLPPPPLPVVPLLSPGGPAWPSAWNTAPSAEPAGTTEPQPGGSGATGTGVATATPSPMATPAPSVGSSTADALPTTESGRE
jgi:endonuclease/exonuclease/phosphatase family metal-dependent hydrolase